MASKKNSPKNKPSPGLTQSDVEDFLKTVLLKGMSKPLPPEATAGIGEDPAWTVNMKKLVSDFEHMGTSSHQQAAALFNLTYLDALGSMSRTKVMGETLLSNLIGHCKEVDSRSLIHCPTTDVARDRIWNFTDEIMAQVVGSTGMNRDVVVGILAKVLADMVAANKK